MIEAAHGATDFPFSRCKPLRSFRNHLARSLPGIHAFQFNLGVRQLGLQGEHVLLHLSDALPDEFLFMRHGFMAVRDLGSGFQGSPGQVIAALVHRIFSAPLPFRNFVGKLAFQSFQVLLFGQEIGTGHACFFAGVFHLPDQSAQQLLRILCFFN